MAILGTVVQVLPDGKVQVKAGPAGGCESCSKCGGVFGSEGPAVRLVEASPGGCQVKVGDHVAVESDPGTTSLAAFLLFGLPLAALVAGMTLGGPWIRQVLALSSDDTAALLAGGMAFLVTVALVTLIARTSLAGRFQLRVSRVMSEEEWAKTLVSQGSGCSTGGGCE